ncbi:MAG: NAD(P)H-dependent oxidoreductase subunit E [Candidatus Omnitrophica bacterium]|nr:NAD(P)H-dependent oxidoreductase subunit E [Candidatus Omnitrophota bacterium]
MKNITLENRISKEKEKIDNVLISYRVDKSKIVPILQDIQAEFGFLPEGVLRYISKQLNIPLSQIYSISTFYRAFSLKPRGKHLVTVCLGTACHVKGGQKIVEIIQNTFNIKPGETTNDGLLTLETVNCLGACALGPIVILDGIYHGHVTLSKLNFLLKDISNENRK